MIRSLGRAYQSRGFVEEVSAGYPGTWNLTMGGGQNQYGFDSAFTSFEHSCQGTGAGFVKDGEGYAAAMWNSEGDMGDIEAWEVLEPLLYLGRRVKAQTPGMGKYAGGPGYESVRMLWKTPEQLIFNVGEGYVFHGAGTFGGYPDNTGYRHNMHKTNMKEIIEKQQPYPSQEGDPEDSEFSRLVKAEYEEFDNRALTLAGKYYEYDLYLSVQRGGPGLGDPLERKAEARTTSMRDLSSHASPRASTVPRSVARTASRAWTRRPPRSGAPGFERSVPRRPYRSRSTSSRSGSAS